MNKEDTVYPYNEIPLIDNKKKWSTVQILQNDELKNIKWKKSITKSYVLYYCTPMKWPGKENLQRQKVDFVVA